MAEGAARARRDGGRRHRGQYRDRPRHGRRRAWPEDGHRHPRHPEPGEEGHAAHARRRARRGPGGALQEPQQLREGRRPAGRAAGARKRAWRDLRQPVRQCRQPRRPCRAPPAPKSGSRPRARSTASSARSAPAGRWPGSRWRCASAIRASRSPSPTFPARRSIPITRTGELRAEGTSITEGIGQGRITANLEGFDARATAIFIPDEESVAITFALLARGRAQPRRCRRASMSPARSAWRASLAPVTPSSPCCATPAARYQSRLFNPEFLRSKGLPVPRLARAATPRSNRISSGRMHIRRRDMTLSIGSIAPDFTAETTAGPDQLPRLDRRQLGDPVLAPQGVHAGVHHRARLYGRARATSSPSATPRSSASASTPIDDNKGWLPDIEEV